LKSQWAGTRWAAVLRTPAISKEKGSDEKLESKIGVSDNNESYTIL
jgi:hypothetical protein